MVVRNIVMYGPVGTSNDTATLTTALAAASGRALYFPAGTYTLDPFTIPTKTTIFGDGEGTVLKIVNAANADFIKNAVGAADIQFRDLVIDGSKSTMTSGAQARGVYLTNIAGVLFDNVRVRDVEGHGIHFSLDGTQERNRLSNVVIERCGSGALNTYGSCFAVTNGNGMTLSNVHALDSMKAGFRLSGTGFTLNGCIARRCQNGGLVPVSGEAVGLTVNGGFFSDTIGALSDGIRLVGVKNVTLNGVQATGNAAAGVGIYNSSQHITINGGVFKNNGQAGALIPGSLDGRDGITINGDTSSVTDVTITGVDCYDDQTTKTQNYGIRLRGDVDYVSINPSNLRLNQSGSYRNDSTTGTSVALGKCQGVALWTTDNVPVSSSGTTLTTLKSVTLPAATVGRKSGFRVRLAGQVTGTNGTKTIQLTWGGTTLTLVSASASETGSWLADLEVWNTSGTSQTITRRAFLTNTLEQALQDTTSIDTTVSTTLSVTGQAANSGDTITIRQFTVDSL